MLAHSPRIVTNGLVLYLDAGNPRSYPGSGTAWNDLSGNGNNGTLVNGPTYSGGSIVFDGNDDIVTFTALSSIPVWTVSMFLSTSEINSPSNLVYYPFSFSTTNANAGGVGLGGPYNGYDGNTVYVYDGGGSSVVINYNITLNRMMNITATHNGGTYSLYINGVFQLSGPLSAQSLTTIRLGKRTDNVWAFKGNIATASIYNRALTAAEVSQNFNALRGRFGL